MPGFSPGGGGGGSFCTVPLQDLGTLVWQTSAGGAGQIVLTVLVPPTITNQPNSAAVCPANLPTTVTFLAGASSSPSGQTLSYQWQYDGTNLTNGLTVTGATVSGATTPP